MIVHRGYCIIRHSLRYFRHSGLVIYMSKLPEPSVSMPCDYRILQSLSIYEEKIMPALPKVKTSAKSVQTTRVVCTNFSRSLYRLQLKFAKGYAQGPI